MNMKKLTRVTSSNTPKSIFWICVISFPLLLISFAFTQSSSTANLFIQKLISSRIATRESGVNNHRNNTPPPAPPAAAEPPAASTAPAKTDEQLLDGLLSAGFDSKSCLSRYQSHLYRKKSPHIPSEYLIRRLRNYESLHRRCGPGTEPYNETIEKLLRSKLEMGKSTIPVNATTDCKYVVWLPVNGLGNRMMSLVSTFLYAMLTDRVLLVEFGADMSGLFCEPFVNSTWESPTSFSSNITPNHGLPSYVDVVKKVIKTTNNTTFTASSRVPPVMYVDLWHTLERNINYFHCEESQHILQKVRVLVFSSDEYFVPSMFMTSSFQDELTKMFPVDKETPVFHHLGRYLFHPSDAAWGMITRFYHAYLDQADQRIGIQIRVFNKSITPTETIMNQILSCTLSNQILPEIYTGKKEDWPVNRTTSKAVLVTSLYPEPSDRLRELYWSKPTKTGEIVAVYQPTSEGEQKYNNGEQAIKALTEMYLLSMSNVLVTSGWSTFGYVAQGLSGLRPWVMNRMADDKVRDPACVQDFSVEPCFHYPPKFDCKAKRKVSHIAKLYFEKGVRKCIDESGGVKMVGGLD